MSTTSVLGDLRLSSNKAGMRLSSSGPYPEKAKMSHAGESKCPTERESGAGITIAESEGRQARFTSSAQTEETKLGGPESRLARFEHHAIACGSPEGDSLLRVVTKPRVWGYGIFLRTAFLQLVEFCCMIFETMQGSENLLALATPLVSAQASSRL